MRASSYGMVALATVAAGAVGLVHCARGPANLVRPDAARAVIVVFATPDRDVRSKHEQQRPRVVARAGQSTPGQPTTADPTSDRQTTTRARLAAGEGAWTMGGASTAAPAPTAPPTGTASTLAPITSPMATGMPAAFSRPPAWLPSGTSGATLGGTPVVPPFAMTFGGR